MEEEIDLRIYIDALLRWWWLIALSTLLAGGAAFLYSSLMTPMYEAAAGVVSMKSRADISLGSGFESITEDDLSLSAQIQGSSALLDRNKRRLNTLAGMVKNGAIAEQVVQELDSVLDEEEQSPSILITRVRGELLNLENGGESDTIQIIAMHEDPRVAAAIANAWARAFEVHVNAIYGEASYSPFADIKQQVIDAKIEYDAAQQALVTFLAEEDRIDELTRQVKEEKAVIEELRTGRQDSAATVISQQVDVQRRLFNTSVAAEMDANLQVYELQHSEWMYQFTRDYDRLRTLSDLLLDAKLMRAQLVEGGAESASSNGLALLAFKSKVFSTTEGLPFENLDITTPSVGALLSASDPLTQVADLDALIVVMDNEVTRLETSIQSQVEALEKDTAYQFLAGLSPESLAVTNAPSGQALQSFTGWPGILSYVAVLEEPLALEIAQLENHLRALNADIVELQGRKDELQKNRDLTWTAYQNLLSKEQEIAIATTSAGSDVRFAIPAVPPRRPVSPQRMMNTAIGLAAGGMLGIVCTFLFEYLGLDNDPRHFLRHRKDAGHSVV